MSFLNKITITLLTIALLTLIFLVVGGMDMTKGFMFLSVMKYSYIALWVVSIPYIIWSLFPARRSQPLGSIWKAIGWLLLILGYPPVMFTAYEVYHRGWNWLACIYIPIF